MFKIAINPNTGPVETLSIRSPTLTWFLIIALILPSVDNGPAFLPFFIVECGLVLAVENANLSTISLNAFLEQKKKKKKESLQNRKGVLLSRNSPYERLYFLKGRNPAPFFFNVIRYIVLNVCRDLVTSEGQEPQ